MVKNNRGFTLIEVAIATAICSLIVLTLSGFFDQAVKFFHLNKIRFDLQLAMRTSLSLITKNLTVAKKDSIVITRHSAANPPYSKIIFETPTKKYAIFQDGRSLFLTDLIAGTTRQIATHLSRINFFYPVTTQEDVISVSMCFERHYPTKMFHLGLQKIKVMN